MSQERRPSQTPQEGKLPTDRVVSVRRQVERNAESAFAPEGRWGPGGIREQFRRIQDPERGFNLIRFEWIAGTQGGKADWMRRRVRELLAEAADRAKGTHDWLVVGKGGYVGSADVLLGNVPGKGKRFIGALTEGNGASNRGPEVLSASGASDYLRSVVTLHVQAVLAGWEQGKTDQAVLITTPDPCTPGNISHIYHATARATAEVLGAEDQPDFRETEHTVHLIGDDGTQFAVTIVLADHYDLISSERLRLDTESVGSGDQVQVKYRRFDGRWVRVASAHEGLVRRFQTEAGLEPYYDLYARGSERALTRVLGPADAVLASKTPLNEAIFYLTQERDGAMAEILRQQGFNEDEISETMTARAMLANLGDPIEWLPSVGVGLEGAGKKKAVEGAQAALQEVIEQVGGGRGLGWVRINIEPDIVVDDLWARYQTDKEVWQKGGEETGLFRYIDTLSRGVAGVVDCPEEPGRYEYFFLKPSNGSGGAGIRIGDYRHRGVPDRDQLLADVERMVVESIVHYAFKTNGLKVPTSYTVQKGFEPMRTCDTMARFFDGREFELPADCCYDVRMYTGATPGETPQLYGGLCRQADSPDNPIVNLTARIGKVELWRGTGFNDETITHYLGDNGRETMEAFARVQAGAVVVCHYLNTTFLSWWQRERMGAASFDTPDPREDPPVLK